MKGKAALLIGAAAGYVLGARAGRERYQEIMSKADQLWHDPKVQEKASQAQEYAKQKAPEVRDKAFEAAAGVAGAAKERVASHGSDEAPYPTSATTGLT